MIASILIGTLLMTAGVPAAISSDLGFGLVANQAWRSADELLKSQSFSLAYWNYKDRGGFSVVTLKPVLDGRAEAGYVSRLCLQNTGVTRGTLTLELNDGRIVGVKLGPCPNPSSR